jgi:ABC-type multidrug transport system permease subunit
MCLCKKVLTKYFILAVPLCPVQNAKHNSNLYTHHNYYEIMLLFMISIIQFIISFLVDAVFRKSDWELLEILYSSRNVTT